MNYRATSRGRKRIREEKLLDVDHQRMREADFSGRKLVGFSSVGSRFEHCRFDEARIDDGNFGGGRAVSEYIGCSFDGARITFGPGGYARFVECSFSDVDLQDWFCFAVELIQCRFSGRLQRAFFNGTVPEDKRGVVGRERNAFWGNDFSALELIDVGFRTGIDLTQQQLPGGPEYLYLSHAEAALARTRRGVVRWDDLDGRRRAMARIRALESELEGGQQQLLLRRDDFQESEHAFVALLMA